MARRTGSGETPRSEVDQLRDEVASLRHALDVQRRHAAQWQEVAEERRVTLERLRQRRVVRFVLAVAGWLLPLTRRLRSRTLKATRVVGRVARALVRYPDKLAAPRRQASLERTVAQLPEVEPDGRRVAVVVLTHDGLVQLRQLLPRLRELDSTHAEIVVVDNGSGYETRSYLAQQSGVRVVRSDVNLSYSDANNLGAEHTDAEVLCFLNDDVVPLRDDWLWRLVRELSEPVVAVGAQLVYPRRTFLESRTRDVTVQHLGIEFESAPGAVPRARNRDLGGLANPTRPAAEVAAVTGACLVVQRVSFDAVGGFDPRYHYGAEDVDLCWRLREAGGCIVVAPDAVLYHNEGTTRHRDDPDAVNQRQRRNWELFESRFGPAVRRAVDLDRLRSRNLLCPEPIRAGITITRDLESAGYGDWYTAHQFAAALGDLGWDVTFLERYRDAWYDGTDALDIVVVLHDLFDVRRVERPGLTTVAWIRNWTDRWMAQPWFGSFDLVLASSRTSVEMVAAEGRHRPELFPLAVDPRRFTPRGGPRTGVIFTGNYWGRDDRVQSLLRALPELQIYGKGWDEVAEARPNWRGRVPFDQLHEVYGSALVVVDQTVEATRPYGALNSRVFESLASGALVVTDQVGGGAELFGDALPTYDEPSELTDLVRDMLADPEGTSGRALALRDRVVAEHTYAARAQRLRDLLVERTERPRIVLRTSCPDRRAAPTWGDWHLGEAFARALSASGHTVHVEAMDEWHDSRSRAADIAVHLKGRSRAPRYEGQIHVIWNISHPEELTDGECDAADLILVAGPRFADPLVQRTDTPVEVLLQATDHLRFYPHPADPRWTHDVAFVGNSRYVERPIVRDALAAGLDVTIYGSNWERFVDPARVRATFIPNEDLPVVYSSVKVLLNDHWDEMREWGFVSNRIYDALACGACVVSDDMPELAEQFGDAVAMYGDPSELASTVSRLLSDEAERRRMGQLGRQRVLEAHTFERRAEEFLELVLPLWAPTATGVEVAG